MKKSYVLYNPHARNGRGEEGARRLGTLLADEELVFCDITEIEDYDAYFADKEEDARLILCGGDGTLNCFANRAEELIAKRDVYYFATGSGNDFLRDLGITDQKEPLLINPYLRDLPTIFVNGKESRFLNGIGYGIDGYCCEVADKKKQTSEKPVNYTTIALYGLLGGYTPTRATVTVDGETSTYEKVWLAPVMNGRFFGGGFMATPGQDRLNGERIVSLAVMHGLGRAHALTIFPSVKKGTHIKRKKHVKIMEGKDITVSFDRPTALQIDGETVLGVTEYRVVSAALMRERATEEERQAKEEPALV